MIMASILGAVLSFVVVTIATYVSAGIFTGSLDLGYSAVTAAITSVVWFGVTYLVSGVLGIGGYAVALGPLLAVIAYFIITDLRYKGTIVRAVAISIGTWVITFGILYVAAMFGYSSFEAIGVPPGV